MNRFSNEYTLYEIYCLREFIEESARLTNWLRLFLSGKRSSSIVGQDLTSNYPAWAHLRAASLYALINFLLLCKLFFLQLFSNFFLLSLFKSKKGVYIFSVIFFNETTMLHKSYVLFSTHNNLIDVRKERSPSGERKWIWIFQIFLLFLMKLTYTSTFNEKNRDISDLWKNGFLRQEFSDNKRKKCWTITVFLSIQTTL